MSSHRHTVSLFTLLLVLAGGASAQIAIGSVGLTWTGSSGSFAGTVCGNQPPCGLSAVTTTAGETVTIAVRGGFLSPYAVGYSQPVPACVQIPGISGGFMLDPAGSPLAIGTLDQGDPILSCPGGLHVLQGTIPPGLPLGVVLRFQAFTYDGAYHPAFTSAIDVTVI